MGLRTLLITLALVELAPAQTRVVETTVHNFATPPKGASPHAGVIRDTQGNLYGTTYFGGTSGLGTVFKVDPSGQFTVLHSFTEAEGGATDAGVVRDNAGNLYGTTPSGGAFREGTVYRIDISGRETVVHSFASGPDGHSPFNGVIRDGLGNLYGTTIEGGAFNYGTVFKIDSSGQFTVLYSFSPIDGFPSSGVILDRAGNLYGTAIFSELLTPGEVFKIDSSGHETILHTFGQSDGSQPNGELIRDDAGNLYGITEEGGVKDGGTVYKLDPAGHETVLHSFTGPDGAIPQAGLFRDGAGNLYGTTNAGGASNCGTVFKIDPAGQETVVHSFDCAEELYPDGGVIRDGAGNLYGTTVGDVEAPVGRPRYGTVYRIDFSGQETVLHTFKGGDGYYPNSAVFRDGAGNLFGSTGNGGSDGQGTVYKIDRSGRETVLHSFTGLDGAYPEDGYYYPYEAVIEDDAGNVYGTTPAGGASGFGTVFKIDPRGQFTLLHSFGGLDGEVPYGGVVRDSAGNLYGTTAGGGASGFGTVFKIDPAGQETVLYSFSDGRDAQTPLAGVILDSAGNLYGTTSYGGVFDLGAVFKIDAAGQETVLYSFKGPVDGSHPQTGVVRDGAGNLYGTTSSNNGVVFGNGTAYKLDPSGQLTVLYSFRGDPENIDYPNAGLVRDSAGNLYGTITNGGAGAGSVYKLDPSGRLIVLYSFQGSDDGYTPVGVTVDGSGNLIGTTIYSGTKLGGTVFELKLNPYSN